MISALHRSAWLALVAAPLMLSACSSERGPTKADVDSATATANQANQTAQQALQTAQKAESDAQAANQRADQMYNRNLHK